MKKLLHLIVGVITVISLSSCTTAFALSQTDGISTEIVVDYGTVVRYGTPYYYNGVISYYHYNGIYYYPYCHNNIWYVHPYRHIQPRGYVHHHNTHNWRTHHSDNWRRSSTYRTVRQPRTNHSNNIHHGGQRGHFGGRR